MRRFVFNDPDPALRCQHLDAVDLAAIALYMLGLEYFATGFALNPVYRRRHIAIMIVARSFLVRPRRSRSPREQREDGDHDLLGGAQDHVCSWQPRR